MNFTTTVYRGDLQSQCVDLLSDTWNFNRLFPGLRRPNVINELFFAEATADANYSELILDESGRVAGYLFGTLSNVSRGTGGGIARKIDLGARVFWYWVSGQLGPRMPALKRGGDLLRMVASLEADRRRNDAYVNLFLVGSTLRGLGWGKRLMRRFEEAAVAADHSRVYLWTDKGCNYHFYDRQGFERTVEVSSPYLADFGTGPNGYAYAKELGS